MFHSTRSLLSITLVYLKRSVCRAGGGGRFCFADGYLCVDRARRALKCHRAPKKKKKNNTHTYTRHLALDVVVVVVVFISSTPLLLLLLLHAIVKCTVVLVLIALLFRIRRQPGFNVRAYYYPLGLLP